MARKVARVFSDKLHFMETFEESNLRNLTVILKGLRQRTVNEYRLVTSQIEP